MPARKLHVSSALSLPTDVVTSTIIVYGGKGMGKTNFGSVLVEELAATGLRFSVLDPMGVWYGLRHSEDGKGRGIEVLILGGVHGDIPIEPTAGAVVADLVVDEDANVVIDISRRSDGTMWSIGERIRFVADYCKRLYQRQGEQRRPLMQLLDEAARFCPQIIRKGDDQVAVCMGAVAILVEEGRNVAIGVCLITQRSARLNKDVAELADCMIAFRTVGPNSRRAVLDWLGEHVEKERLKDLDEKVRALPRGSALVVSPGWLEYEGVVPMRARQTFDSSATPKAGKERRPSGKGAKPNLAKYQQRMAATIEKAKADDPRALKRQIADLTRQLQRGTPRSAADNAPTGEERELRASAQRLQAHADRLTQALERVMKFIVEINTQDFFKAAGETVDKEAIQKVIDAAAQQAVKLVEQNVRAQGAALEKWRRQGERLLDEIRRILQRDVKITVAVKHNQPFTVTPTARTAVQPPISANGQVSTSQQRILNALAWLEGIGLKDGDKTQVALLADQSPSSGGYFNNLGTLRTGGYISYPRPSVVALTDAGRALASDSGVPQSTEELHQQLFAKLSASQSAILKALIKVYPQALSKADLAELAGNELGKPISATSGGYFNNLGALRSLKLIDYPSPGTAAALPVLFLEGRE